MINVSQAVSAGIGVLVMGGLGWIVIRNPKVINPARKKFVEPSGSTRKDTSKK